MTNRGATSAHEGPVSTDDGEIEVTPEMVEARFRVQTHNGGRRGSGSRRNDVLRVDHGGAGRHRRLYAAWLRLVVVDDAGLKHDQLPKKRSHGAPARISSVFCSKSIRPDTACAWTHRETRAVR